MALIPYQSCVSTLMPNIELAQILSEKPGAQGVDEIEQTLRKQSADWIIEATMPKKNGIRKYELD